MRKKEMERKDENKKVFGGGFSCVGIGGISTNRSKRSFGIDGYRRCVGGHNY